MHSFRCRVVDRSGKVVEFDRHASSAKDVARELSEEGYAPVKIRVTRRGRRFSKATVLEFTESLALMLRSGLSVSDALDVSVSVFPKGESRQLIETLHNALRKGDSLHQVLERLGASFPPVYRGLIRIGEKVGTLDDVVPRLAAYLRTRKSLREKLVGASLYPLLVLLVAIAGLSVIGVVVLPRLSELFSAFGTSTAERLTRVTDTYGTFFLLLVLGVAAVSLGVATAVVLRHRLPRAARAIDKLLLRLPVAGPVIGVTESLNFSFAMETLIGSGVSMDEALTEAAGSLSNRAYSEAVAELREEVVHGRSLSAALLRRNAFPERLGRWVAVGERTGNVDAVFGQMRVYYQGEIDKQVSRFMSLAEPALIILVGAVIISFVVFLVLPIFSALGSLV